MSYTVYIHTFPNGKKYVGVTGQRPENRWRHGKAYRKQPRIYRAILKYGWENVTHDVSHCGLSKKQAYEMEKELISKFDTTNPSKGYNNSIGGSGGSLGAKLDDKARKNISAGHIGLKHSEETKLKLSNGKKGEKNPNYGKHPSETTLQKMSEAQREVSSRSNVKESRRNSMKKRWDDENYRKSMSEKAKGENNYFYGKRFFGSDNPHFGKHLTNEQKENLIKINSKPIMCVETGKVYPSATVAENAFGVAHGAISHTLDKENKTSCGFHWKRLVVK